jgi:alpha-1,6-mannosyltransferase
MKILDVTEFYSERGGGVRSHLALKSHVLCQLGHEHVVVAPGGEDRDDLVGEVGGRLARQGGRARVLRVRGPASPYDSTYHLLLRFDKIAAIVARERPDVLEIHSPYLAAAGALRARTGTFGIRTFQWHSDFVDTYGGVLEAKVGATWARPVALATRPLWGLARGIARRCDATLVAATWQVDKLRAHDVPRIVHHPFGIERAVFRREARTLEGRHALLAEVGRPPEDRVPVVVAVGRFAVEKRWDVVLDGFARLRRERDVVLVAFGDGPERARMQARVREHGLQRDVALPGFVKGRDALARALASADLMIHACPFETFGLSIVEALASGLPVVVPDEGGAAEMHVEEPGVGPSPTEPHRSGDAEDLARAAGRLLLRTAAEGRDVLGAAATRASLRYPSVEEQFERQVALYTDLLERAGWRARAHGGASAT